MSQNEQTAAELQLLKFGVYRYPSWEPFFYQHLGEDPQLAHSFRGWTPDQLEAIANHMRTAQKDK